MAKNSKTTFFGTTKIQGDINFTKEELTTQLDSNILKKELGIKDPLDKNFYGDTTNIGEGGVGIVLKGYDPNLGRDVAIKILRPEANRSDIRRNRFFREARATAQLEHPNIVPVHEIGVNDKWGLYFTMKPIAGEELSVVLDELILKNIKYKKKYSLSKLLNILIDVGNGLSFAHSKGMIHRDLKPDNIFIGDFGEVLILDWGLVKDIMTPQDSDKGINTININAGAPNLTIDGRVSGTPYYMSPEQACGKNKEMDCRSDVYSLGVILYQMLTLKFPFDGESPQEVLNEVARGIFIPPIKRAGSREIPKELNAICLKAMSYYAEYRYQTVKEMSRDIYNYLDGYTVSAMKYSFLNRFVKYSLRHKVISSIIATFIIFAFSFWTLIGVTNYFKYSISIARASIFIDNGIEDFQSAKKIYNLLHELRLRRVIKTKSPEEKDLEVELVSIENNAVNSMQIARAILGGVPETYKKSREVNKAFILLVKEQLSYAFFKKDYSRITKLLNKLGMWLKIDNTFIDDKQKEEVRKIRELLIGDGYLTINSNSLNVSVECQPIIEAPNGAFQKGTISSLGETPIKSIKLPQGRYILNVKIKKLSKNQESSNNTAVKDDDRKNNKEKASLLATSKGCSIKPTDEIKYPFVIEHSEKKIINLELPEYIPNGMVYIPGGEFYIGGTHSKYFRLHKMTLPSFFIKKYEVTVGEYLEFYKTLPNKILRDKYAPMIRLSRDDRRFTPLFTPQNGFKLNFNNEGISEENESHSNLKHQIDLSFVKLDFPIVGISQKAAAAYCSWLSIKNKIKCRLPTLEEWEKAARGADGRDFPWGNNIEEEFAFTSDNFKAKLEHKYWAPVGSFKKDNSIYGVKDLAGNAREWTSSKIAGNSFFQIKGASSSTPIAFAYCASSSDAPLVPSDVGFRYVISLH